MRKLLIAMHVAAPLNGGIWADVIKRAGVKPG
jgi:hypothetical protein